MFDFLKKNKKEISDQNLTAPKTGMVTKLFQGLKLTRQNLTQSIKTIFNGKELLDPTTLAELETKLLTADVGITVTNKLIEQLKLKLKKEQVVTKEILFDTIKSELLAILEPCNHPLVIPQTLTTPFVILLVGVNGAGKTTTIGKLAKSFQEQKRQVILAAGDTFRAAAIEQLKVWGERNRVAVIAQKQGADSAAVIYDALQAATARGAEILLADTAGRLHTNQNFMEELKKITRTLQKIDRAAPHEVLLVLDATIGQNALQQVKQFNEAIGVTGICITKLDGTAKGGVLFSIAATTKLPIRFIGLGEGSDDLKPFNAKDFVTTLFGD